MYPEDIKFGPNNILIYNKKSVNSIVCTGIVMDAIMQQNTNNNCNLKFETRNRYLASDKLLSNISPTDTVFFIGTDIVSDWEPYISKYKETGTTFKLYTNSSINIELDYSLYNEVIASLGTDRKSLVGLLYNKYNSDGVMRLYINLLDIYFSRDTYNPLYEESCYAYYLAEVYSYGSFEYMQKLLHKYDDDLEAIVHDGELVQLARNLYKG